MSVQDEVIKASEQFYAALNRMVNGDASPLANIWSHSASVTTMHPIGGMQTGWNAVQESWQQVAQLASGGQINMVNQFIQVDGDMAYELGFEQGQAKLAGQQIHIEDRVTNIYRCEGGNWKIVHHHTDVSPEMVNIVSSLQPKM